MYEITTESDSDAGSEAFIGCLEREERVGRIELPYSAWKSYFGRRSESRPVAQNRTNKPNRPARAVTNEAQNRAVSNADVAYLLYPRRLVRAFVACVVALAVCAPLASASTPKRLPPAWRTWLEVCSREQPKAGVYNPTKWSTPNWTHDGPGVTYPGGCGMTRDNYRDIRLASWPATMNKATPAQQLWACHRLFWKHARIGEKMLGSYEAGQRYGSTVWDVHDDMGWRGFKRDGVTWQ